MHGEVLIEESLTPVTFKTDKGCRVVSGNWLGAYSGDVFTDASLLDIDHLVPLKEAHESGGFDWDADRRRDYANDLSDPTPLLPWIVVSTGRRVLVILQSGYHQIRRTWWNMQRPGLP